ncbi:MAG: N-6 DNA methylase, partial [Clostridia bacterium]|nr:N-6 DNA methylase [Clostridia bacterium]
MAKMEHPESLQALIDEWRTFAEAHAENPGLLRFRFYRPMRLLRQLEDLQREPLHFAVAEEYNPQLSRFISMDEIDHVLRGYESDGGSEQRLSVYSFFLAHPDSKERESFLKEMQGTSGSHGGNDNLSYDSGGMVFSHGSISAPYAKIEWNWTKVRKRIETLIEQNRFLSDADRLRMSAYEQKQIARSIVNAFTDAPQEYERPFRQNAISDYWESVETVQNQLTDPTRVQAILETLASLKANTLSTDRGYEERHKAVVNLTAYRKGEFSLFGGKREAIPSPAEDVIWEDELLPDDFEESSVLYRPYAVDDTVYLDGTEFRITNVTSMHVELIDPTIRYPIFRTESKANFERLLKEDQRNAMFIPPEQQPQEPVQEELPTVELPPAAVEQSEAAAPQEEPVKLHSIVIDLRPSWEREFQEPEPIPAAPIVNKRTDFRITDDHLGEGGAKTKFQRNVAAIRTLKAIEAENRLATPEEQAILSQYVGWGGLPDAFDDSKEQWQSEYAELKELLTDSEYESARASTLNAHYTSPVVIRAMYEAIGNMGFQTGNILEPSCGIGNFFGMLPERMRSSKLYGVELDDLTGRIAKQLYQNANVRIEGFEESVYPDSFFDVAIGNVPFGDYPLADKRYDKNHFLIHDYFFAKALDKVRPGGVVAFITSSGTMDKANPSIRKYIAQRAELLGAIRLPNNAFRANAGTDVVADILFLQKRDHPIEIDEDWLHIGKSELGYPINEYFLKNPDMILGELTEESARFGMGQTVKPIEGADL